MGQPRCSLAMTSLRYASGSTPWALHVARTVQTSARIRLGFGDVESRVGVVYRPMTQARSRTAPGPMGEQ